MAMRKNNTNRKGSKLGQVYILSNPAMPGLVKIGFTRRTTRLRVSELSGATGVPMPFKIEWSERVRYPEYRINRNREFFRVSPASAKKQVKRAAKGFRTSSSKKLINYIIWLIAIFVCAYFAKKYRFFIGDVVSNLI
jgi:hypothetical protein